MLFTICPRKWFRNSSMLSGSTLLKRPPIRGSTLRWRSLETVLMEPPSPTSIGVGDSVEDPPDSSDLSVVAKIPGRTRSPLRKALKKSLCHPLRDWVRRCVEASIHSVNLWSPVLTLLDHVCKNVASQRSNWLGFWFPLKTIASSAFVFDQGRTAISATTTPKNV